MSDPAPLTDLLLEVPEVPARPALAEPVPGGRVEMRFVVPESVHEQFRYAQTLLSHAVPNGDPAEVLARALSELVATLEKRRFGVGSRPRARRRTSTNPRHIPAHVRRAVWARDGGRCTFVSDAGHRCDGTWDLELDHIRAVGRGGEATTDNLRLRCGAHNQLEADRTYGGGFMRGKREAAKAAAAARRAATRREREDAARHRAGAAAAPQPAPPPPDLDVIPWLRGLGFRMDEARRGAASCAHLPHAPLEQRLRCALASLTPAHMRPRAPSAVQGA